MKKWKLAWIPLFPITLFLICLPGDLHAEVNLGISIGEEGLRGFHLSIGNYFRVPEREVVYIRERRIPEPEIPVVFFIAGRAHVAPAQIVELRLKGQSWMSIVAYYRLSPEIFYVPVSGPPYGRAYGHLKKPKKEWRKISLRDDEVVSMVNLKFISEHHRIPPEQVIRLRSEGRSFAAIDALERWKKDNNKKGKGSEKDKKKGKGDLGEDYFTSADRAYPEAERGGSGNGRGRNRDNEGQGRGKGRGKH